MNDVTSIPVARHVFGWRWWFRGILGVTLGAGAIWLVFHAAGGLGDVGAALRQTNPWWLIPAAAFEALSYLLAGVRLRRLVGDGVDLTTVSATELELVVNGLGLLTPASPAEGLAFAATELSRRRVPRRRIGLSLGFASWFSARTFYLAGAVNLLFIVATRDLPVDAIWPLTIAAVALIMLAITAVLANRPSTAEHVAVVLGALRFWKARPSRPDRRCRGARFYADAMAVIGTHRQRAGLAFLSLGSMMSDVACLWFVLIAVGARVDPDIA